MPDTQIDAELSAEARTVLGRDDVSFTPLAHGQRIGVTSGVFRVQAGDARAVVKVVAPAADAGDKVWRGSHDPANYRFWEREALFYEAGQPQAYADAGIALPGLLGAFRRGGGEISLWMQDVSGNGGASWTVRRTEEHARQLGRAQGTCVIDDAWRKSAVPFSRNVLRDYLDTPDATSPDINWDMLENAEAWDTRLMRTHFGGQLREDVLRLCRERYQFVSWGEALPHTLCHHDLWPNNVFEHDGRLVLVDWAFAGEGWVGGDIGNFVSDTALDLLRPSEELPALDEGVFRGYVQGLRDAGYDADERAVRLGMCVMAAKWTWLIPVMLTRATRDNHEVYGSQAVDADRLYAERANVFRMLVAWAAEARALAAGLFPASAQP
ncbi:phosphotransferase [Dactylosporangium sp. CA-052675]|uniref:phosphotransferase n=1 Tax=Dactylosporangium sp. CA-052675 TaxID=3239927 RepID=UPI003D93E579